MACIFQHSARAGALQGAVKGSMQAWLQRLDDVSRSLSAGTLAPRGWQREVEDILGKVELADFLRSLDFDRLAQSSQFPAEGEGMQRLYFEEEDGRLRPLAFRPFLFTLRRGTAVVPHGHHNMATMHMVLGGRARVRHFDRLDTTPTDMLIRPASDVAAGPGEVTSISDEHQNIHWFDALTERVYMFNIAVYQLRPGPFGERDYIDPLGGKALGDGSVRAPRLARAQAYAKYGHA